MTALEHSSPSNGAGGLSYTGSKSRTDGAAHRPGQHASRLDPDSAIQQVLERTFEHCVREAIDKGIDEQSVLAEVWQCARTARTDGVLPEEMALALHRLYRRLELRTSDAHDSEGALLRLINHALDAYFSDEQSP